MITHTGAVAVLTRAPDPTATAVIALLADRGVPAIQLDAGSFPSPDQMTARWRNGVLTTLLHLETADVDLSTLRSIWYRRPREFSFSENMTPDTRSFAAAEARQGFAGALMTSPATWINRPEAEAVAGLKMVQLLTASRRGLTVPDTVVTNHPDKARAFLDTTVGATYKRLSVSGRFDDGDALEAYDANAVGVVDADRLAQIALTPCLFQRPVDLTGRIRITVVGDQVIASRVELDTDWQPFVLPGAVRAAAHALTSDLGLRFATIDLAQGPRGDLVFLGLGSSGRWTCSQDGPEQRVRAAIVDLLATSRAAVPVPA